MKFLIVGGCPRSGTTLLAFMLNRHRKIAMTNDFNLSHLHKSIEDIFHTDKNVKRFRKEGFRELNEKESWNLDIVEAMTFSSELTLPVIEFLYHKHFEGRKDFGYKTYYGDKHPRYFYGIDRFQQIFPDLTIIHVTRNPFDVINSMKRRAMNHIKGEDEGWKLLDLSKMCDEWSMAFQTAIREDIGNIINVQYEDLVFDNKEILSSIFDKLNLEFILEPGYEPDTNKEHHFKCEYLEQKEIEEISERIDLASYKEFLEAQNQSQKALERLKIAVS
jgi:hypothetical protein